jgi:Txe/YoeB family toxin of Txe-Axe toxin-antitoxin module
MAKEIALKLKITSQGEEKVISNLNELETELKILQETLKTLDFGTAAFKEATRNIATLRTKIDEIDKASEGIGAEKKFRAIGDAINILTGSFQVLSGAIGLFTSDSETLEEVQKAETAALNVLNIALGINAVNTALVESATLRKTIAEKASTLATKAATIAQRAFNAVLSANPIALVITAVVGLGAAMLAFSKETKNATKELDALKISTDTLDQVSKDSIKTRDEEIKKISSLVAVSETENLSKKDRTKILKQIQAEYPDYLKNQDLEKVSLGDIKRANEDLVSSIDKVAKARASADKLGEIYTKRIQIRTTEEIALVEDQRQREEAYNLLDASQTQKRIQVINNLAKIRQQNQQQELKTLDIQEKSIKNYIVETDLVGQFVGVYDKGTKAAETFTDKELQLIQLRIAALDKIIAKINEAQQADIEYTSTLLNNQEEVIQEQEQYIKERGEFLKSEGQKLIDDLNEYLFKTIPSAEEVKKLSDGYKDFFTAIQDAVKSGDLDFRKTTGWEDFVKFAESKDGLQGIGEKLKNVNDESRAAFVEYFNNLDERVSAIKTKVEGAFLGFFDAVPDDTTLQALLKVEEDIAILRRDRVKLGLTEQQLKNKELSIIKEQFGINKKIEELAKVQAEDTFNYFQLLEKGKKEEAAVIKTRIDERDKLVLSYNQVAEAILTGVIRTDNFVKGLKEVGEQSDKNLLKIKNYKEQIDKTFDPANLEGLKNYFKQNADDFLVIFTDILDNEEKYFGKLGEAGITALFSGIDEGLKDVEGKTRTELENIQKFLKVFGDEFAKDFGLAENPFLKTLNAISKKLKELPTESQEAFTKTLNNIKDVADKVLSAFQQISSGLSNIVQLQNSLLLEQLDYQQAQALKAIDEINDDSEEGQKKRNEERLKAEKDYQKKRFEIEKKARVQELQFALANALASSAQAIIGALATPPLGVGIALSAVLAGLTAFQVGVINDQIQFTQNKQYLGRTGGLVEGSSHDTYGGGVPTLLEGGEFILNKEAVRAYGDQISMMSSATGGKPMSIDDSRIVQAIAKQNLSTKTPLKAYVLYNDIQDTTKLNKKIEQLARL